MGEASSVRGIKPTRRLALYRIYIILPAVVVLPGRWRDVYAVSACRAFYSK